MKIFVAIFGLVWLGSGGHGLEVFPYNCGRRTLKHPQTKNVWYEGPPYLGQWPWYGTIYHHKHETIMEYACGCTLISEKFAITATLCITQNSDLYDLVYEGNILVRFGTHNQNKLNIGHAQHRHVAEVHTPSGFHGDRKNEIVILELSVNVNFNDYVQAICIDIEPFSLPPDGMIGWGAAKKDTLLGKFQLDIETCPNDDEQYRNYYNQTKMCENDRGSMGYYVDEDLRVWFIRGVIDCNDPSTVQCTDKRTDEKVVNFIRINHYLPWIVKVTNIDYLQIIRKGQKFNPSTLYPNLLPRMNCGHSFVKHNESDTNAQLFEYPWIARVVSGSGGSFDNPEFMGTLINQRYVLTSAIILLLFQEHNSFVKLGEYILRQYTDCNRKSCAPPVRIYDVEYIVVHPDYKNFDDGSPFSVALVRTTKEVLYEDHIHPVCLPVAQELRQLKAYKYVLVSWAIHSRKLPAILQQATVLKCANSTAPSGLAQMCTKNVFKVELCVDTLGAPLGKLVNFDGISRFVQFGIQQNANCGGDELYITNIGHSMDWIIANVKE